MEKLYTPKQIQAITGVSPDSLRQWRKLGYLDEYGQKQESGHWLYTQQEARVFLALRFISESFPTRLDAAELLAGKIADQLKSY